MARERAGHRFGREGALCPDFPKSSPIDLGALFRDRVFERVGAVVLTSATLTGGGGFKYLRSRMGLDESGTAWSSH